MKAEFVPGMTDEMTITTAAEMGITHLGPNAPSMLTCSKDVKAEAAG